MMAAFIVMFVLLLATVGLLFYPWSGRQRVDRNTMNHMIYRARMQELGEDLSAIDETQQQKLVNELRLNLLEDLPESAETAGKRGGVWVYILGAAILTLLTVGVFVRTGSVTRVMEWQQVVEQTPQLVQRVMDSQGKPLSREELFRLALGLRTRLQQYPQNTVSWIMLGRLQMVLNNPGEALQAFDKARGLAPQNPEAQLGYVEALLHSSDPNDNREAQQLLDSLLKTNHDDVRVLSLVAFNAFEHQQYDKAIGAWQLMLQLLPADDPQRIILLRSIEQAKKEQAATLK
ncbi:c-type cytochrome biogenesis protein CcmI [Yokenella regensburgei]|nr:c-type cytochrome biogenesis protein CcmI [Yokenella regensburgei]KFD21339.1 cytochrome c heme lyase subunit [Yokenella regensburgei ATCC 49455]SQA66471.1 Cytochrome c-type biogenesis protein CcmH precursor [Yokenella regensburgei]SUQ05089.1 Cytochrome c-type biogenesis protein CcmH precursor [Yokenella regensburgei]